MNLKRKLHYYPGPGKDWGCYFTLGQDRTGDLTQNPRSVTCKTCVKLLRKLKAVERRQGK